MLYKSSICSTTVNKYDKYQALKQSALGVCCIIVLLLFNTILFGQKPTKIELITANTLTFDKNINKDVRRLIGDVILKHDETLMYCDSAYLYGESNKFDAFGNILIKVSDTVNIWGDILKYDGNNKMSELQYNCRMVDNQSELTSEFLFYDMKNDIAFYNTGGNIDNGQNNLKSRIGKYYSKDKMFFFKDSVVLTNPRYIINCDTLKYNTVTEVAYFLGPTTIVSDENTIYCENGWYDTKNDISQFNRNASLKNQKQTLTGDSLFYDRKLGIGKAINNISVTDTEENLIIYGDVGEYDEVTDFTRVTKRAYLVKIFDTDSLFLHADTLISVSDTITGNRTLYAYRHVKFFKPDMQGVCDSIVFSFNDSLINLYGMPVLWSEENQLTADSIIIVTGNSLVKELWMFSSAFIVSKEDTANYNQIKGKNMIGYFKDNTLNVIDVKGNGQTVYLVKEDNGAGSGINTSQSADLRIMMNDNKVDKILFLSKPDAVLYPMDEIPASSKILKGFRWLSNLRPLNNQDIFNWIPMPPKAE